MLSSAAIHQSQESRVAAGLKSQWLDSAVTGGLK